MTDAIGQFDGTVTPAWMKSRAGQQADDMWSKLPLRMGRVVRAHYPGDPGNRNGYFTEYDVLCEEGSENTPTSRFTMHNCWMMSDFGAAADFTKTTPRVLEIEKQIDKSNQDFGKSSWVLVLCVNASAFAGVIIGGMGNTASEPDTMAQGHQHIVQFNGLRREINKDGEFVTSFKGATKEDGSLLGNPDHAGTTQRFAIDGSLLTFTKDDNQHFNINHGSTHTIDLLEDKDFKILSNGTCTWEAKGAWNYTVGGTADVSVNGGNYNMNTPVGLIKTSGLGVHLGLATDFMVKGTTYRIAETVKHQALVAALTTLIAQATAAGGALSGGGAALLAVSTLHKVPVVGPVLASVPLMAGAAAVTAAGGIIASMAGGFSAMLAGIQGFEAGTPSYLSLANKLD